MRILSRIRRYFLPVVLSVVFLFAAGQVFAQQTTQIENRQLYEALKEFRLQGTAKVENLKLKRDRVEMEFTGDFYFAAPINGRVTGAVFIGEGTFHAPPPPIAFEHENLVRLLGKEAVDSNFKTAVLRFTDDTFDIIGKGMSEAAAIPGQATDLARDLEPRMLEETGANISARLAISLANKESPGFFMAQFDKGSLDRFTFIADYQARIPTETFGINGGEKIIIFQYAQFNLVNDVWIATYSEEDFEKGQASYSDDYDIVAPLNYNMEIDLRDARKELRTKMRIDFESAVDNLRVLPMMINEDLTEYDNIRLDESMRIVSAQYNGRDLPVVQEDWEKGITFFLPEPIKKGGKFSIEASFAGDFISNQDIFPHSFYPQSNTCWYPRHGYLKRSTFDLIYRLKKNHIVASSGTLVREEPWPDNKDERLAEYRIEDPVALVTFAAGQFERHEKKRKLSFGEMDLQFYSFPGSFGTSLSIRTGRSKIGQARPLSINEDFMLAEMGNALNYYCNFFGTYPYKDFKAALHPFSFGQGLATLLMLPPVDTADRDVFKFIAHETSHQWWGNMVAWRSYRDQWLSEGFAEYSGMLYTWERDDIDALRDQIEEARDVLEDPPVSTTSFGGREYQTGVGEGKVAELGPLILGRRLSSRHSRNGYQSLTYDKGALVLRMLHFLFTDFQTGNGDPFFNMMTDFVKRYTNKAASTENFQQVANEHFVNTPIAKQFRLKDLNWFFREWVYEAKLPSYKMEYRIQSAEGGKAVFSGTIFQENAGPDWFMPLPVTLKFPGDQKANIVLYANGPETPFEHVLPMKPNSAELDPDMWILAEHTKTDKK